jgi:hypothetical protein
MLPDFETLSRALAKAAATGVRSSPLGDFLRKSCSMIPRPAMFHRIHPSFSTVRIPPMRIARLSQRMTLVFLRILEHRRHSNRSMEASPAAALAACMAPRGPVISGARIAPSSGLNHFWHLRQMRWTLGSGIPSIGISAAQRAGPQRREPALDTLPDCASLSRGLASAADQS